MSVVVAVAVIVSCDTFVAINWGGGKNTHSVLCKYKLTEDLTGSLYCGITLDWNYTDKYVDISMPRYIKKKLKQYDHAFPNRAQICPYLPEPKSNSAKAQAPLPDDNSKPLDKKGIRKIQ